MLGLSERRDLHLGSSVEVAGIEVRQAQKFESCFVIQQHRFIQSQFHEKTRLSKNQYQIESKYRNFQNPGICRPL